MEHLYYGLWDNVAKCYAWVGESKNDATFARMCNVMAKDEKTFVGQSPEDYKGYHIANYRDWETDRKSTRLNSSHRSLSRMPSSA